MPSKTFDGRWRWVNDDGTLGGPCPPPEDEELAKLEAGETSPCALEDRSARPGTGRDRVELVTARLDES